MRLGVDFGTTHTVIALVDRGNYPVVSFEHGDVLPSLIAAGPDGELRFGHAAAALQFEPGWHVLRSFKRLLDGARPGTTVPLGGREWELSALLTRFLSFVREQIVSHSNAGARRSEALEAAVSVPAHASTAQRLMTVDAYRRAGFDVKALLNEPSAAGFEYAHRFRDTVTSRREYVLVYDLGGGTFDASLIKMEGRANEVITSNGIARLGGDDFDEAILDLVVKRLKSSPADPRFLAKLREEVRIQKEAANPNTRKLVIDVGKEHVVLPIEDAYDACAPLMEETLLAMEPAMRDPRRKGDEGVAWSELAGIYVVGGASSFPAVYRRLREQFGAHRVRRSPHPFGSCAIGLAIHLDTDAGYRLSERLTRHFGVFREEEAGHRVSFDVLVPKDTPLPHTVSRRYRAAHNVGHFRFVECARIEQGRPEGNLALWDEVLFPFDPRLRDRDLKSIAVHRVNDAEGPEVEEIYRCNAEGELEVQVRVLDDGFARTLQIGRR